MHSERCNKQDSLKPGENRIRPIGLKEMSRGRKLVGHLRDRLIRDRHAREHGGLLSRHLASPDNGSLRAHLRQFIQSIQEDVTALFAQTRWLPLEFPR